MAGLAGALKDESPEVRVSAAKALGAAGDESSIPALEALLNDSTMPTNGPLIPVRQAAAEGVDTFITGEGPHWTYALAEELGLNVFYGGHYATETFGVKALAAELSRKFHVPWIFLDTPFTPKPFSTVAISVSVCRLAPHLLLP